MAESSCCVCEKDVVITNDPLNDLDLMNPKKKGYIRFGKVFCSIECEDLYDYDDFKTVNNLIED